MSDQRPTHNEIAVRAYELYLSRGCKPGKDVEDWLTAETQLMFEQSAKSAQPARAARKKAAAGPKS